MKRIIALFLLMMFMTTGVLAEIPSFLTEPMLNYSGDYTMSVSFDNSDEVVSLINEMGENSNNIIDWSTFLKTLLTFEGKGKMQMDIDDDLENIKLSFISESSHNIDFNRNLNVKVNAGQGMWIDANLSNSADFDFDIIYSSPMASKYVTFSPDDIPTYSGVEAVDLQSVKSIVNKYFVENLYKQSAEILGKYADYAVFGTKHIITMDNEGFTSYVDEIMSLTYESTYSLVAGEEDFSYEENIPSLKGYRILGDEGIKYTYTIIGGKVSAEELTVDISIDLTSIYADIMGEPWPYSSPGKIDFTLAGICDITSVGTTKVEFPVLTDENSVSYRELYPYLYYEEDYSYEDYAPYPYYYAYAQCEDMPVIDGEIYVPLRGTLEAAYEDSVQIEYTDGLITATSEYFPDFTTLRLAVDSDKAYVNDAEYAVDRVILKNGTTYVSNRLFADIFGWEFASASYDMIDKCYYYSFYTELFY